MALLGMVLCTSLRVGIQNGLTSKLFKDIEEMLLQLYYLCKKQRLLTINVPIHSQGSIEEHYRELVLTLPT